MVAVLELFDKITDILTQLAELERDKAAAVRKDDLTALDKSLKQEQVLALSIRGLEQKRTDLLSQFGLLELPLSDLPGKFPADQRMEAKKDGGSAAGCISDLPSRRRGGTGYAGVQSP